MKKVLQDVADVTIRDKETGMVVATTEAQMSSISQTISEEDLRGGIGNGRVFLIRSDKTIDLTLRSATFDPLYLAITQGVDAVKDKSVAVTRVKVGEVGEDFSIKIPYKPMKGEVITARSIKTGTQIKLDDSAVGDADLGAIITIPNGDEDEVDKDGKGKLALAKGDKVTITYKVFVKGDSITFDSAKFSKKYEVEYRTIAYDQDSGRPDTELYFIFPEVIPSGEFDMSLENGSVYTPEFTLSVNAPIGSTEMGQFISVKVGELDEEGNPILPEGENEITGGGVGEVGDDEETKTAREALKKAVASADSEVAGVVASTDGSDIDEGSFWAPKAELDAVKSAISKAKAVANDTDATAETINKAVAELKTATDKFAKAKKEGTKK